MSPSKQFKPFPALLTPFSLPTGKVRKNVRATTLRMLISDYQHLNLKSRFYEAEPSVCLRFNSPAQSNLKHPREIALFYLFDIVGRDLIYKVV